MNRYLNSFFITSGVYFIAAFFLFFVFADMLITPPAKEEIVTKISLNSVSIVEPQPVAELTPEPIVEPQPVIEKPKPVKNKPEKPKKEHKKPVEKIVQKEEVAEVVAAVPPPPKTEPKEEVSAPSINQNQIDTIETKYLAKVRATIEKNKIYPKAAKRLNQTGKVNVNFDILKNGEIRNVKVLGKSSFAKLDEASIELLIKISNFDEIPEELKKSVWNVTIPIDYSIN
ncbi:energy transducer TonB [Aliarcobacter butzleri]|uniref:TonB-denpendent receptor n=1 Tax=Aliarcobacter butzleri L351 TaxID=1447259 RepID=A0A837J3P3_9BACT|nr:energy transducer TonB [Aliarcobacter butzleri]KLD99944.1 TonB-denpendent receptor [Aliarcobacter butzleri L351]KLE12012.1 TonB-denpendent receptor [Aliarcobacter butzleri L350]MDN5047360.1 TonB family protein [Aliarcobacter butzleri]MDN5059211.1 TonB family protein [Aliarcobacter butzleri]MDN5109360.1 TonB family protein [Aliarcobacter butzleri]